MKQSRREVEYRNRGQMDLGMVDLNNLIDEWLTARAVWAVLEGIDFSLYEEQIRRREGEAGAARRRGGCWRRCGFTATVQAWGRRGRWSGCRAASRGCGGCARTSP